MDIHGLIDAKLKSIGDTKVPFDTLHFMHWYRMDEASMVLSVAEANKLLVTLSQKASWLELTSEYNQNQKLIWLYLR